MTRPTLAAGTVVHDEATVGKAAATPAAVPAPTGTVTFTLYDNGTCNGTVVATDANKPLSRRLGDVGELHDAGRRRRRSRTARTTTGTRTTRASDAACEPFSVERAADGSDHARRTSPAVTS